MAPYASTYSVGASPQMVAPVTPEMMYASPEYLPAQYAYPQPAYAIYEEETSDSSGWANVAMLAVAGAVVGGVMGYKTKQAPKARAGSPEMKAALLYSTTTGNTETAAGTNHVFYAVDFWLSSD